MLKAIAYLDDAARMYADMNKPKYQWRAVLIRQLTAKLKAALNSNGKQQR